MHGGIFRSDHAVATRRSAEAPRGEQFDARALDAERARLQDQLRAAAKAFDAALPADAAARDEWHAYLKWDEWAAPLLAESDWNVPSDRASRVAALRGEGGVRESADSRFPAGDGRLRHVRRGRARRQGRPAGRVSPTPRSTPPGIGGQTRSTTTNSKTPRGGSPFCARPRRRSLRRRSRFAAPVIVVQVHRDLVENKLAQFQRTSQEQRTTRNRIQGASVVGAADVSARARTAQMFDAPERRSRCAS